jgi:dTDP-4-dehydrorhamnose reductase
VTGRLATSRSALVTGAAGQLGADLAALAGAAAIPLDRAALDVTDGAAVDAAIGRHRPAIVYHCAAYVDVDGAESDPAGAFALNAAGTAHVARAAARHGARLVTFSTNYAFAGDRAEPYGEDDAPSPRGLYAISKVAAEHAALAYAPGALVIRTAGLYGRASNRSKGGNFVERILRAARDRGSLAVVSDQTLSPTFTADLAEATVAAVAAGATGILHLTNAGACSWHRFTEEILQAAGVVVPLAATRTTPRPGVADRPANGVLARGRADRLGLAPLRDWRAALAAYMSEAGLAASPRAGAV